MKRLLFFLVLTSKLIANYRFEGFFGNCDGELRYYLISFYVPYNPYIVALGSNPLMEEMHAKWWSQGKLSHKIDPKAEFLWIESDEELTILQNLDLTQPRVIYTSTHAQTYPQLKRYLEISGFTPLSHWYHEEGRGDAIYLSNEIYTATMRTYNYTPLGNERSTPSSNAHNLCIFFKPAPDKGSDHHFGPIDFIYMINLDERPKKFADASFELEPFGIYPYRFSAVNGWKLSTEALTKLGCIFTTGMTREHFMATTYLEKEGVEYQSNDMIQEDGITPYFSFGMSRGSIGICLSHLSVLQDAYDNGYNMIWVMEDDVEVVSNPSLIPDLIQRLTQVVPDWDILFTDTDTKDRAGNHVPCRALAAKPNFKFKPLSEYFSCFYNINSEFSRIGMRYGAYSMIIRRSGVEKILRHFKTYGIYLPYDMDYWLASDLKMYSVNKDIISHRALSPSDNNKPHYDVDRDGDEPHYD